MRKEKMNYGFSSAIFKESERITNLSIVESSDEDSNYVCYEGLRNERFRWFRTYQSA
jgi:hypothetical protein